MAIINKQELKNMGIDDIKSNIKELKKELIKHSTQIATGTTPKSPGRVREIKKTIARLLTSIKNKEQTNQ